MRSSLILGLPSGANEFQLIGAPGDPSERNAAYKALLTCHGEQGKWEAIELWSSSTGRIKRKTFKSVALIEESHAETTTETGLEMETELPTDGPTLEVENEPPISSKGRKK